MSMVRRLGDPVTSLSRHYLFDPSADMLYNPWLAPKAAWPEKDGKRGKRREKIVAKMKKIERQ